jgi:hypothetical protein
MRELANTGRVAKRTSGHAMATEAVDAPSILCTAVRRALGFEPQCDLRIAQGVWGSVWTGGSKGFEAVRT